ncbi:MAG: hypothetical protein ACXAC7_03575 [Candidatus Hodarchaeales archaeon]|jgi:hypothetical protein
MEDLKIKTTIEKRFYETLENYIKIDEKYQSFVFKGSLTAIFFILFVVELIISAVIRNLFFNWIIGWANLILMVTAVYFYHEEFKKTTFYLIGLFFAFIHFISSIPWILGQWMQIFIVPGLITSLGEYFKFDLIMIAYLIMLIAILIDITLLILFIWCLKLFYNKSFLLNISFNQIQNLMNLIDNNKLKKMFKSKKNVIEGFVLLILIIIIPFSYLATLNAFENTSDGITYLLDGITELNQISNSGSIDSNQLLSNTSERIEMENTLFQASRYFINSRNKLESLNFLGFYPIFFLAGISDDIPYILELLDHLTELTGITIPDLMDSISDYLEHMDALTNEIINRGIWWELPEDYNSKGYFFDKLDNSLIDDINQSIKAYSDLVSNIEMSFSQTFLSQNSNIHSMFDLLSTINSQLFQILEISQVGFLVLNATFASVEVTNALAFDQFITARNLTDRANKYVLQAQTTLNELLTQEDLLDTVNDLIFIMNQFTELNHEFANMTSSTEHWFFDINKTIEVLNLMTYNGTAPSEMVLLDINNKIDQSTIIVRDIVIHSLEFIQDFLEHEKSDPSVIQFPFRDIFYHFEWFFTGYLNATSNYRDLWIASNNTISLFSDLKELKQNFTDTLNYTRSLGQYGLIPHIFQLEPLYNQIAEIKNKITATYYLLNNAPSDGAIKTNETLWRELIGFRSSEQQISFFKIVNDIEGFLDNRTNFTNPIEFYQNLSIFEATLNMNLNNLTGNGIYLGISQEIITQPKNVINFNSKRNLNTLTYSFGQSHFNNLKGKTNRNFFQFQVVTYNQKAFKSTWSYTTENRKP